MLLIFGGSGLYIEAPPQTIGIALAIGGNLVISFALALTKYAFPVPPLSQDP